MARLVRVTRTRYVKNGKRVTAKTRGATKVAEEDPRWYGQGLPGMPATKRVPLATDKVAAQRMLDNLVRDAEQGRAGLPDHDAGRKPLSGHLDDFRRDLELGLAGGRHKRPPGQKHANTVCQRLRDLLDGCKFRTVGDLNSDAPAKLARHLRELARRPKAEGGLSAQTVTFFLGDARRFARWLSTRRVGVAAALFDAIPGFDPANNRKHARREIAPAELGKLLDTAKASARTVGHLSGEDRHHLYLTAFATGFRSGELARLTPASFDLAADPPSVSLPGRDTKNKKSARQILPPAVAAALGAYLAGRPAGQPVWPGNWKKYPVKLLKADLADAGVPYQVEGRAGPEYADFHALRHTFVTALSSAGVGPKELQELARHSDPRLTLGLYTHARSDALIAAVNRLHVPGSAPAASPFAHLNRDQLEQALFGLTLMLGTLLGNRPTGLGARRGAQPSGILADSSAHLDTSGAVADGRP